MSIQFRMLMFICVITGLLTACATAEETAVAEQPGETPAVVLLSSVTPDLCLHEIVIEAYHDVNANSQLDPAEAPIKGIKFGLLRNTQRVNEALIAYASTGVDGRVTLQKDAPGCLEADTTITPLSFPPGYHLTQPSAKTVRDAAASEQPVQFGFKIVPVTPRPTSTSTTPLGGAAPQMPDFHPCDLVTETEVEQATGIILFQTPEAYAGNIVGGDGNSSVCDYVPAASITINVPAPTDDLQNLIDLTVGSNRETISGLGDMAYWSAVLGDLHVIRRNVWLAIRVKSRDLDTSRALAERALPRLDNLLDHPNQPAPTAAPSIEACDVLTVSQAESILGLLTGDPTVESAISEAFGIFTWCVYSAVPNSATVAFTRFRSPELAAEAFNNSRPPDGISPADVVQGVGDRAVVGEDQHSLLILRGTVVISITISGNDAALARNQVIAIGKIVVVRIP